MNMKKLILFGVMTLMGLTTQAQNIQLHYDFGRSIYSEQFGGPQSDDVMRRQKVTLTLEQFKADNWGSWFYFVDIDFSSKFVEGAYAEISREFNLGKQSPFAAHIEYNGGLNRVGSYQQAALLGAAYNGHSEDFSKTWSVQLMYKQYFKITNAVSMASSTSGVARTGVQVRRGMACLSSSPSRSFGIISPITSLSVPRWRSATTSSIMW